MTDTIFIAEQVIDGVQAEPLRDHAVIVRDDRIQGVEPLAKVSSRTLKEARVVEAPGHTVMPGLIDCHTHLVFNQYNTQAKIASVTQETAALRAANTARILVSHGYTSVRDVGSRESASISVGRMVREGRLKGPRVLASGGLISTTAGTSDSYPPWIVNRQPHGVIVDGAGEIQAEVRRQAKMGASHVKLGLSGSEPSVFCFTWMSTMSEEEVQTAVAEAHRLRMRVACHSEAEHSSLIAARAGCDTIEHGTRLTEESADLMKAKGIVMVPTLCTLYSVLELGEKLDLSVKQREEMVVNQRPWLDSLAMAKAKGIKIAAGGDIGNRYRHGENARELALLAQNGFSAMEAVQAATSVAAEALGFGGLTGQVRPNCWADLVLFEGDPLQDLTLLLEQARFKQVLVGGNWMRGVPDTVVRPEPVPAAG